jgi:hypothetical protein
MVVNTKRSEFEHSRTMTSSLTYSETNVTHTSGWFPDCENNIKVDCAASQVVCLLVFTSYRRKCVRLPCLRPTSFSPVCSASGISYVNIGFFSVIY